MADQTIDHTTLVRLAEAGAVREADVVGTSGGWSVIIKYGMAEHALAAHRGVIRIFGKFETLVAYLKGLGIAKFTVNAADYDPAVRAERKRPDSAERMRRAYEAAKYDVWFREQVQQALDDSERPDAVFIPHAEVKARWAAKRAEIANQAEQREQGRA